MSQIWFKLVFLNFRYMKVPRTTMSGAGEKTGERASVRDRLGEFSIIMTILLCYLFIVRCFKSRLQGSGAECEKDLAAETTAWRAGITVATLDPAGSRPAR